MHIEVLSTDELGDRSYIAHDGVVAVVIDPQRDVDRLEHYLAAHGLRVGLVLETHIHNDYVTGGYQLARRTGARYGLHADDPVTFDRLGLHDGDTLTVGTMHVQAIATPGHTFTHLAYVITNTDIDAGTADPAKSTDPAASAQPPAVFTGGSLLYGSVGRTDLISTQATDELTRAQYRSAHRLADTLPDDAQIYPTHGFGSFCSTGSATGGDASTLGRERSRNDALTAPDEDSFVDTLVANLTAYPAYYAHMAPRNRTGPAPVDLSVPERVDALELSKRIAAGEWVVDLRERVLYAAGHLAGSVGIALGPQFATYLGWLMPWDTPLTLIGADLDQVAAAQRQLVRIGIDRPAGAATGDLDSLTAPTQQRRHYRRVTFTALDDRAGFDARHDVVLDVRRDDERAGGYLVGSLHIPLHELLSRLDELPDARLWVHCASGYRASIAASLLDRAGHDVVLIDDDYANANANANAPHRPAAC
jgi:hydroxyacylglutathione hydrolase